MSNVDHPKHYQTKSGLEVIDVIKEFELGFNLGNAVKYILRYGKKSEDPTEDIEKAIWYLKNYIDNITPVKYFKHNGFYGRRDKLSDIICKMFPETFNFELIRDRVRNFSEDRLEDLHSILHKEPTKYDIAGFLGLNIEDNPSMQEKDNEKKLDKSNIWPEMQGFTEELPKKSRYEEELNATTAKTLDENLRSAMIGNLSYILHTTSHTKFPYPWIYTKMFELSLEDISEVELLLVHRQKGWEDNIKELLNKYDI